MRALMSKAVFLSHFKDSARYNTSHLGVKSVKTPRLFNSPIGVFLEEAVKQRRALAFRQIYWLSLGVNLSGRTDRVVTATNTVTAGYNCVEPHTVTTSY